MDFPKWAVLACTAGLLMLGDQQSAAAHPHVWVDYYVDVVGDKTGLTKLKFRWHFDEMFSSMMLGNFGIKSITPKDVETLRTKAFANLKNYHYYITAKLDGSTFEPTQTSDFGAALNGKNLEYTFTVTFPTPAKTLELSLYDPEYYVDIGPPVEQPLAGAEPIAIEALKPKKFLSSSSADDTPPPVCEAHQGEPRVSDEWGKFALFIVACHTNG